MWMASNGHVASFRKMPDADGPGETLPKCFPSEADYPDEVFDVVDENNKPVGRATRRRCHEEGLLHRSTHVFVFRTRQTIGRLRAEVEVLLQKRSQKKKVGGGLWDVSVAEHLSEGENYVQATARGLSEELGIRINEGHDLVQIRQAYLSRQYYEEASVLDHMFTCTFGMVLDEGTHGKLRIDEEEVECIEWWPVSTLVKKAKTSKELFTRWLLIELDNLNLMEVGKMMMGEV